jgi:RNA polymerase sigma factor for flagellar operon FliA
MEFLDLRDTGRMDAAVRAYRSVTQKENRDLLVTDHLHCVRHVLARITAGLPEFVDVENLEAAGVLGLVEAASQFDPSKGTLFTTFAYFRIRGAIYDELRRNCPLPQHVLERWTLVKTAWAQLGEHANVASVALHCQLKEAEVEDCLSAVRITQPDVWKVELAAHHRVTGETSESLERANEEDERALLADAIERLPPRLRTVLSLYYLEGLRLAEIGEVLKLSESRISRLLATAQMQLKSLLNHRRGRHADEE